MATDYGHDLQVTYRPALSEDSGVLAALNLQLIRDEGHRNEMSPAELEQRMRSWLAAGEYDAVVFERTGAPLGYCLFKRHPDHVYIRQFHVDAAHRRRGIGRQAMMWLWQNSFAPADRIRLDVLVGNSVGASFWRGIGFTDYCITMEMKAP